MKAVEYQKCYENMEAMKIDLTSNKGKYTVDHYSIIQEIDQVQKKQTVHKARFTDIEREVSLLKIQIREAKKDDVCVQSLKKRIKQLRSQIVQVETRLTVKMEQLNPVSPVLVTKKSTINVCLTAKSLVMQNPCRKTKKKAIVISCFF